MSRNSLSVPAVLVASIAMVVVMLAQGAASWAHSKGREGTAITPSAVLACPMDAPGLRSDTGRRFDTGSDQRHFPGGLKKECRIDARPLSLDVALYSAAMKGKADPGGPPL